MSGMAMPGESSSILHLLKRRGSTSFSLMIAGCVVSLTCFTMLRLVLATSFLKVECNSQPSSRHDAEDGLKWEGNFADEARRHAIEDQELFCRVVKTAAWNPNTTRYTVAELETAAGGNKIAMVVHAGPDLISDLIKRDSFWDQSKVRAILNKLNEVKQLRGVSDPSDIVFVDIGANMGVFTLSIASHGYKVLAFEPMVENEAALRQSICLNSDLDDSGIPRGFMGLIILYRMGLSSKQGTCSVMSDEYNYSNGRVICANESARIEPTFIHRGKVDLMRIDDILSKTDSSKIGVIKIDVEGYEPFVLAGGPNLFLNSKIPFIVTEFSPTYYAALGMNASTVLRSWHNAGYEISQTGFAEKLIVEADFESIQLEDYHDIFLTNRKFTSMIIAQISER